MIDDLCNSFTAEIRQIIMNNRMKATCTEEKFIKIITYHDTKILKKEELKTIDEIFRTTIRNMVTQIKKRKFNNLVIISF